MNATVTYPTEIAEIFENSIAVEMAGDVIDDGRHADMSRAEWARELIETHSWNPQLVAICLDRAISIAAEIASATTADLSSLRQSEVPGADPRAS